jgi:DNA repair protein RecO (recombination protein O)
LDPQGLQAAFVLHTRRYGDSSLIVDLLTRDQGRIGCIAKGALRAHRSEVRFASFQPLLVATRGRGEVATLVRVESAGPPLAVRGRDLYCGLYLNELIVKLTARHDPMPGLFDDYARAIGELAEGSQAEPALRRFEVRLLTHLGLGLSLEVDDKGQPINASNRYNYIMDAGPTVAKAADTGAVNGQALLALGSGDFEDGESMRQARLLMRRIINHHLDGRELRSRELFR